MQKGVVVIRFDFGVKGVAWHAEKISGWSLPAFTNCLVAGPQAAVKFCIMLLQTPPWLVHT